MTQETAALLAIRALVAADTRAEKSNARKMAEAVMAGRGFVLWRGSPESRTPGYIFGAFADRVTCERAMRSTVWAATEEARGRDLAEACKIHGFEILEISPDAPPLESVWHIHAEHPTAEPVIFEVYTDQGRAVARCVELVNLIRDDRDAAIVDQATPDNWRAVLSELQDECPGLTFYVNLDRITLRA